MKIHLHAFDEDTGDFRSLCGKSANAGTNITGQLGDVDCVRCLRIIQRCDTWCRLPFGHRAKCQLGAAVHGEGRK